MASYRMHIHDNDGVIVSSAEADCTNDREAGVLAESLLEVGQQAGIWEGLRLVGFVKLGASAPRTPFIE